MCIYEAKLDPMVLWQRVGWGGRNEDATAVGILFAEGRHFDEEQDAFENAWSPDLFLSHCEMDRVLIGAEPRTLNNVQAWWWWTQLNTCRSGHDWRPYACQWVVFHPLPLLRNQPTVLVLSQPCLKNHAMNRARLFEVSAHSILE